MSNQPGAHSPREQEEPATASPQLPVLLPRAVNPNQPFRPLNADDKALLVKLATRSGYIAPLSWSLVAGFSFSGTYALIIYAFFFDLPIAPNPLLAMMVAGVLGIVIGGSTWIKRMIERRQAVVAAGLERRSTLRMLRKLSRYALIKAPLTLLSRAFRRKNRISLKQAVERKIDLLEP